MGTQCSFFNFSIQEQTINNFYTFFFFRYTHLKIIRIKTKERCSMNIRRCILFIAIMGTMFFMNAGPAKDFSAEALFPDGRVKRISLSNYRGQKVVLYFYPKNGTPGCTRQAKVFRDNFNKLQDKGIVVIGISYDSLKSHKKFQEKHQLPFMLVCDETKSISKEYGTDGWFFPSRKTILIDEKGNIVKRFESVDITHQIDDILKTFSMR